MPVIIPTITANPFPTAMTALNYARERVNDLISTPAGAPAPGSDPALFFTQIGGSNLLDVSTTNASNRTQIIFQSAWDDMCRVLEDLGYREFLEDDLVLSGLPPNTNPDPSAQSFISWTEFFDGTNYWPAPVLPTNFRAPLKCRERVSGTNTPFADMHCGIDGLNVGYVRGILNRSWEWRANRLYLVGANGTTDLKPRFILGLPPISAVGNIPWYYLPLPIPDCATALACHIAVRVGSARGPEFVADLKAEAKQQADYLFNRQARADQRVNARRRPRSGGPRKHYAYGL